MTTEYEASVRLVCWGDTLQPADLAKQLKIAPAFYLARVKGEPSIKGDGTPSGSVAKTGMLIYSSVRELADKGHDPEAQLSRIADMLRQLPNGFFTAHGVDQAQLQMFFYYERRAAGEPDFFVPPDLLHQLTRHAIEMSVSILA